MTKHRWRSFFGCAAALLPLATPTASPASPGPDDKPPACVDTTPHKIRMVKVAPGVELEVLDWGGKGPAMVLITGTGDNAHVFDQFAYQFTDYFHVIGITRRGYLPSSQPRDGYDVPTRAKDDIAVLDDLGIRKAVFVGHSAGGMELSRLGQAFPSRVEKLVYLDAVDLSQRSSVSGLDLPLAAYTEADLKSLEAYQAAQARLQDIREPVSAVCPRLTFDAGGALADSTTPDWVSEKFVAGMDAAPPQDWSRVKAPRLGIFAPHTDSGRQAWYWYLSPAAQAQFDKVWPAIAAWHRRTIDQFAEGNAANTHRLPGAPHYVYINNEAQVVRWMRAFLEIPPGA